MIEAHAMALFHACDRITGARDTAVNQSRMSISGKELERSFLNQSERVAAWRRS